MILGAVGTLYALDNVSVFFFAWVAVRTARWSSAIIFGGAAGLLVAAHC